MRDVIDYFEYEGPAIYIFFNSKSTQYYVGQTTKLWKRLGSYVYGAHTEVLWKLINNIDTGLYIYQVDSKKLNIEEYLLQFEYAVYLQLKEVYCPINNSDIFKYRSVGEISPNILSDAAQITLAEIRKNLFTGDLCKMIKKRNMYASIVKLHAKRADLRNENKKLKLKLNMIDKDQAYNKGLRKEYVESARLRQYYYEKLFLLQRELETIENDVKKKISNFEEKLNTAINYKEE